MSRMPSIPSAADYRVRPAIVVGHTGPDHGPASQIRYSLDVGFPSGWSRVDGISPVSQRWPDTQDTVALSNNTVVMVLDIAGQLQMTCCELPYVEPCSASRSGADQEAARIIGAVSTMTPRQLAILRQAILKQELA